MSRGQADLLFCDFCSRGEHEVKEMIKTQTDVAICNVCVAMCVQITLDGDLQGEYRPVAVTPPPAVSASGRES